MAGMIGSSLASVIEWDAAAHFSIFVPDLVTYTPDKVLQRAKFSHPVHYNMTRRMWPSKLSTKKRGICSTAKTYSLNEEETRSWEECRRAFSPFNFSVEEQDKILEKAFGHVHSPYWSEERQKEVPNLEAVTETLDYLRSLSLSDDDICKLLKKFPEVLGCCLQQEVQTNVQTLAKDWGIEGKSLKNLLLRNPKVLGYNVDCKGDCMAKCTRCWVRF
ncbi:hypothetical protein SAY87_029578 [Trapa incisa]|uniref:Mitochondrial transcription termination factor family protein n=1 Tax=Trapa incisa TaxID=236973 RepID=A0AAN7K7X9_9MYRT|nr:hypothetical protein SAY87_029578 [Trapa incisa]